MKHAFVYAFAVLFCIARSRTPINARIAQRTARNAKYWRHCAKAWKRQGKLRAVPDEFKDWA